MVYMCLGMHGARQKNRYDAISRESDAIPAHTNWRDRLIVLLGVEVSSVALSAAAEKASHNPRHI